MAGRAAGINAPTVMAPPKSIRRERPLAEMGALEVIADEYRAWRDGGEVEWCAYELIFCGGFGGVGVEFGGGEGWVAGGFGEAG